MASYSQPFGYQCRRCGNAAQRTVWLVVDGWDRPDLVQAVASGAQTRFTCDRCQAPVELGGFPSLLVRRPNLRPPLLFATAGDTAPDRVREQFTVSMAVLARGGGPEPGGAVEWVPYALMPVAVERDVEADLDAVRDGTFRGLSPDLQRYGDWLRELSSHRWRQATQPALTELLDGSGPASWRATILANPALLTDAVDELLGHLIEETERENQPQLAEVARHRRLLLRQCRRHGVDAVLPDEPPTGQPPAQPEEPPADPGSGERSLPPAVGAALLALAGMAPEGTAAPTEDLRDLLGRALLELPPDDAALLLELRGEYVPLGAFLSDALATELLNRPRRATDVAEALRRCKGLDELRDTAPYAWAQAQHNAGIARAKLADPGDIAALDEARDHLARALTVRTAQAYPDDWALTVVALGNLLILNYPSHLPAYLDEALAMLEDAIAHAPRELDAVPLASMRASYAAGLLRRAERANDDDALARATELLAGLRSDARVAAEPELLLVVRTNLGLALSHRAERTGRRADWQQAVAVLREALDSGGMTQEQQWVSTAGNLGIALRHSGEYGEAVALFRDAIDRCAAAGLRQQWAAMQNNLGNALVDRPDGDRDENLAEAIAAYERARTVWTRESFSADWALTTGRLAAAYEAVPDGRARAGELLREAVDALPREANPTGWARLTNRLAGFQEPGAAIALYRQAAEVLRRDAYPFEWAALNHNLGLSHRQLARATGAAEHAARAVECFRAALAARPAREAPIDWAQTATTLATTLAEDIGAPDGEPEALLDEALATLRCGAPAGSVLDTASRLAVLRAERGRWAESAAAFREALAAADRLYRMGLLRSAREQTLSEHGWLTVAAAHTMAQAGRPDEAVATLESGRTRLLADALARDPAQLDGARLAHPREYAAYVAAVRELARAEAAAVRLMADDGTDRDDPYRRRAEQAVRDELRRTTAAFEAAREALPATVPDTVDRDGHAAVYLFVTGRDAMALIVGAHGVETVLSHRFDAAMLRRFVHGDDANPGLLRAQTEERGRFAGELARCLTTVGEEVVAPVAYALRQRGVTAVTLVPVGLFSAVPLHAAPYQGGRCLIDDFAVSYAPSLTVLNAARRSGTAREGTARRGVAVVDPGAQLPFADQEARTLLAWTGGDRVEGASAGLLDALSGATHVHFACHGQSTVDRPLHSHLVLGGGRRLALLDLLTTDREGLLGNARLVVASACQTAMVDATRTPDEFIGLPAGFLLAGVPCFLGSLWPSGDVPSTLLMTRFYELLFAEGRPADAALGTAQAWLRDLTGAELLGYLRDHPDLAGISGSQLRFATHYPDRRFYRDPTVWSPYILIGAPTVERSTP